MPKGIYDRIGSGYGRPAVKSVEDCVGCELPICTQPPGCNYSKLMRRWEGRDYERRKEYHAERYRARKQL
jgi:hypothetical protein